MKINRSRYQWFSLIVSVLTIVVAGCSGGDSGGSTGAAGAPGTTVAVVSPADATALTMTITGVTISSPPVVNFSIANQNNVAVPGVTLSDLRFTIAKLVPGTNGAPSKWQNYINTASSGLSGGYVRGNRENNGTLVDHLDGTYTYTFKTDITNTAQTCPAAPCIDADGNTLDTSYNASLTHRVAIQTRGTLPMVNGVYTFRPSDGATTGLFSREIVKTAKCNECHNKLQAHDARIETQYCVMCHNPGSTGKGQVGTTVGPTTVDFKVMIHKIHRGEELPSVVAGGDYGIFGFSGSLVSFKDVVFPQDIRNCTKCHDGAVTAQGNNWQTQPSIAACGSCHDNIDFSKVGPPFGTDPNGHPGGDVSAMTDSSECLACHQAGQIGGSVAERHTDPVKAIAAKFKFNIVSVTGGNMPVIKFSAVDPTNSDAPYNITTDPAFTQVASGVSRIALVVGWNTTDFANNTSGVNPAQPITVFPTPTCGGPASGGVPASADWACSGPVAGVYTLTKLSALPASATGTGRVGFEGHPAALDTATPPAYTVRVPVKSVVKDWSIDGSTLKARRTVVDIAKCDSCHAQLSLHGNNRTDEPQLCVMCHNPNDTDASRRPKTGGILSGGVDGKLEESIDFKRMIHGIHRGEDRVNGIVVYGFGGSVNDFSHVRFPGILKDCTTCHTTTSYQLTGIWESPTQNGILSSTILTTPTATDATTYAAQLATPDDDLNISPTAAVCSSCHDSPDAQTHMVNTGIAKFSDTQATIASNTEICSLCHGPGRSEDVKVKHGL